MGCAHIHDVIAGATIALAAPQGGIKYKWEKHDIVRPNLGAAELVARHMQMLETLGARPDQGLPNQ